MVKNKINKNNCICDKNDDYCGIGNKDGLTCTRTIGHKGKHIACGSITHKIAIWKK